MTRYRIRITGDALNAVAALAPPGFRIVDAGFPDRVHADAGDWLPSRIATVEDDDAAPELEGRLVDVVISRNAVTGAVWVSERTPVDEPTVLANEHRRPR